MARINREDPESDGTADGGAWVLFSPGTAATIEWTPLFTRTATEPAVAGGSPQKGEWIYASRGRRGITKGGL